jgi:hypothetical protein
MNHVFLMAAQRVVQAPGVVSPLSKFYQSHILQMALVRPGDLRTES